MLVVQIVEILWTKATRGAPRSNERANIPRAFPVDGESGQCVVQYYRIAEWEAFSPKLIKTETKSSVPRTIDVLRISSEVGGVLDVTFLGTKQSGQPKRQSIEHAIKLAPGEYARLVVNARHTSYSGQYYSETVYNLATDSRVPPDRFLLGPPEHEVDLKANLF